MATSTALIWPRADIEMPPIPPGANPFEFGLQKLRERSIFASLDQWYKDNLLALLVAFALIALTHFLALVLPLFRKRSIRKQLLWIVKIKHAGPFDQKYYLPNGRVLSSTFSIISSALSMAQSVYMLWFPTKMNLSLPIVPLLPFYGVSHPVAVDLIFAIWVSSRPTSPASSTGTRPWTWTDRLKHPWVLNTLAWVVPVAVIVIESIFQAGQWRASAALTAGGVRLTTAMEEAAAAFNDKGMAGVDLPGLTRLGEDEISLFNHFLKTQNRLMITLAVVFTFEAALFLVSLAALCFTLFGAHTSRRAPTAIWGASSRSTHHRALVAYFTALAFLELWCCGTMVYLTVHTEALDARHSLFEVSSVVVYWGKAVLVFLLGLLSLWRVFNVSDGTSPCGPDTTISASRAAIKPSEVGLFISGKHGLGTDASSSVSHIPESHVMGVLVSINRQRFVDEMSVEKGIGPQDDISHD